MKARVLVVDDEETIRNLLKSRLSRDGFDVAMAGGADEAMAAFKSGGEVGVLVTDLRMPGKDGFALMEWAKEKYPSVKVIVITGHGEKEVAVKALRQGAADYLEKPFDLDELGHAVSRCLREYGLENENKDLVSRLEARVQRVEGNAEDSFWYVSKCSAMTQVNEWLQVLRREAMRGNAEEPSVLILGESGTGKEGIARMIYAGSRRGKGPWIAVNCANFNEQLLESELFGHEKGAFTGATALKRGLFELAKGGTLFLDEIGEMDVKLQAKILRVLQEKVFRRVGGTADLDADVRVIAATNRNLQERVSDGAFREDLYHRLSRVVIEIPALRERDSDIVPMAIQFAERAFRARAKNFEGFSQEAQTALRAYVWPGNVRELLNIVERTALTWTGSGTLSAGVLQLPEGAWRSIQAIPAVSSAFNSALGAAAGLNGCFTDMKKKWSDAFEQEYLSGVLSRHHGNVSAAAREAKIDRSNFLRLCRRHGLEAGAYRKTAAETPQAASSESSGRKAA